MLKVLSVTPRTVTLELQNDRPYYAEEEFSVYVNGSFCRLEKRNVFTLFDLSPDTVYQIKVADKCLEVQTKCESVCLNVKDFQAIGDGISDDTVKIQAAIACCPKNGTVYLPKGTYLISCLFLKSDRMFYLAEEAKIIAMTDRRSFPVLPGKAGSYSFGTWEGSEVDNFASSITAIGAHHLIIAGSGEIDERAEDGDWYIDHRVCRTAWRGFGMYLKDCSDVDVVGLYIHHSPSWNIHPYFSKNLKFLNLRIENPSAMPTTDGLDPDCCSNCLIAGCSFNVGDDCIAIKSGTIALAEKYRTPCERITIRNNLMQQGHGGVVFGSESSGGIRHVLVEKCIFLKTDRGFRIKTRRGRGRIGEIDDVTFTNIYMDGVKTPFVINMYYNMGPKGGHEEYVWSTKYYSVDERTPILGHFTFKNMVCRQIEYAAGVFLGLPEEPIRGVTFQNVSFDYNSDAEPGYPVMIEHPILMCRKGIYALNVEKLQLENVTFSNLLGEEIEKMDTK